MNARPGGARIGRRGLLLLAATSLTAASAAPRADVPAVMTPVRAAPAPPGPRADLRPVAHWTGVYEQGWEYQHENSLPMSRSADSWDHYELSYSVDANVAMFRATDDTRYLDRALAYVENVAAAAVPSAQLAGSGFRDRYRGWASQRADLDRPGDEIPLYESYFWRYGTALPAVLRQHPAVRADASYRDRLARLTRFAEVHVFEKWDTRGAADFLYRERTHMAAHWALIAVHLSVATDDPARRARYLEVAGTIDARLRGQLRRSPVEPTAYFWSDVWGSARRPGQDVSHANGVLAYVTEACDRGRSWSTVDMAGFSALLTRVVWPGGRTYRAHVDGTGADNGWFSDGFVKLGRYDPSVQRRLQDHEVVNDQFAANMALNARILRS